MCSQIPLTDKQKVFLANGIFRAVTQDISEIIYENDLPTTVGSGLFRWNFINRNLSAEMGGDFEFSFQKRGAWKFLILRDRHSKLAFSVMTEQNLKRLQSKPPLRAHYLEALVSDNTARDPIEGQMRMPGIYPERDISILAEIKNQLFSEFSDTVNEHVLVLFDYNYVGVTAVRAVILTTNLEVAVSDDWTKHMTITHIPTQSILAAALSEEDESLVTLKPEGDTDVSEVVNLPMESSEAEAK